MVQPHPSALKTSPSDDGIGQPPDKELYATVNAAGGSGGTESSLGDQIEVTQPEFKPEQFKANADALIEQILQMA